MSITSSIIRKYHIPLPSSNIESCMCRNSTQSTLSLQPTTSTAHTLRRIQHSTIGSTGSHHTSLAQLLNRLLTTFSTPRSTKMIIPRTQEHTMPSRALHLTAEAPPNTSSEAPFSILPSIAKTGRFFPGVHSKPCRGVSDVETAGHP